MILDSVPYFKTNSENVCSTSACLAMLLNAIGQKASPERIGDLFAASFLSEQFRQWMFHSGDTHRITESEMLACAVYVVERFFPSCKADIIRTSISSIPLSYVKRKIPVAIVGKFPLLSGHVPNTIVVHGYVGRYLIVHDPRGNANTSYIDRSGLNVLYHASNLARWCGMDDVLLLRVIPIA